MKKCKGLWILLLEFMRFGCFTFGGGWSIIAQMQQLYVEKEKVITSEELLDLTSVAKSLPGAMIANVAMLYGYRAAGLAGVPPRSSTLTYQRKPPSAALAEAALQSVPSEKE